MNKQEIKNSMRKTFWDIVELITSEEGLPIPQIMPRIEYIIEMGSEVVNGKYKQEINDLNEKHNNETKYIEKEYRKKMSGIEKELKAFIKMFNEINKVLKP